VIRVVVDTNVLVSGSRNLRGSEARVIDAVRIGVLRACVSEEIFREYVAVLTRSKLGFLTDEVAALLATIRSLGEFFDPKVVSFTVPDQSGAKFMACAIEAQADYLVTGNRRHFPGPFYGSAQVVNARELLAHITPDS
jgi:putative PIN family toxin of toxin-antitoxin system